MTNEIGHPSLRRRRKLDEIIQSLENIYIDWLNAIDSDIGLRVKKAEVALRKFRDEEL